MCRAIEEMLNDVKTECALRMLKDMDIDLSYEMIARYSKLPLEKIMELAENVSAYC